MWRGRLSTVPRLHAPVRRSRVLIACCHCGGGMRWVCACPVPRLCVVVAAGPRVLVVVCVCVLCMCASHVLGLTPAAWVGCVPRAPLHCVVVCRLPQSLRARVNLQCANAVDVLRSLDKSACAARVLCASVHAPPFPVFRPGTGGDAAPRLTVVLWSFDQAPPTATPWPSNPFGCRGCVRVLVMSCHVCWHSHLHRMRMTAVMRVCLVCLCCCPCVGAGRECGVVVPLTA